jgi:hypothetical protein
MVEGARGAALTRGLAVVLAVLVIVESANKTSAG